MRFEIVSNEKKLTYEQQIDTHKLESVQEKISELLRFVSEQNNDEEKRKKEEEERRKREEEERKKKKTNGDKETANGDDQPDNKPRTR